MVPAGPETGWSWRASDRSRVSGTVKRMAHRWRMAKRRLSSSAEGSGDGGDELTRGHYEGGSGGSSHPGGSLSRSNAGLLRLGPDLRCRGGSGRDEGGDRPRRWGGGWRGGKGCRRGRG